ncbi:MAG: hypothetical protein R3A44_19165 [Caldilineaceae bacterium]
MGKLVRWLFHWLFIAATVLLALGMLGPQYYTPPEQTDLAIGQITQGHEFNLGQWEIESIQHKLQAFIQQPAADLTPTDASLLVRCYMQRAQQVGQLEQTIVAQLALQSDTNRSASATNRTDDSPTEPLDIDALQTELDDLRAQQNAERMTVEQIIQRQVAGELAAAGFRIGGRPFPPVLFAFTEPPKKLIVSPRDRIATEYWRMLDADTALETAETAEGAIFNQLDLSAYITNIGGLGAFPTMVVDQASLGWVLSTVAHEWTHNYLSLFPLGLNYTTSADLTTINESVAEIVGNEIGQLTIERYYPDLVPPPPSAADLIIREMLGQYGAPRFDFRREMRTTRLEVDRLLVEGKVTEAESYMEQRRQLFVENGYAIRKLNQAYFAFHGSYGASAASSSPIGPQLDALRAAMPDLQTFLHTVRWITSAAELDDAVAQWGKQ